MSVLAARRRVDKAEGPVCPYCARPVKEGRFRRTNALVRLDPEPLARGNLMVIEPGSFVAFIHVDWRDPRHQFFVPPEQRYQSHRATCTANERTCSDETRAFIADVDRRLEEQRA